MANNPHYLKVPGRSLNSTGNTEINIPEQVSNLDMRPVGSPPKATTSDGKFGMPIEADLAVALIAKAYNETLGLIDIKFKNEEDNEKDTLKKLFHLLYGVTFDKSLILKILSQPNCEGLRSYLCIRGTGKDKHVSLVMVGVNINGYDLNYDPGVNIDGKIPTMSLIGEYGFPPGGSKEKDDEYIDEHYRLLKFAAGQGK